MATNRPVTVIWEEKRDLGNGHEVRLRLEMPEVPIASAGLEIDLLMAKAQSAFKHYIDQYAQTITPSPRTPEVLVLPATKLSVKMDGLKRMLRVHAGQFSKHGVPIYKEVLEEMGRDENAVPLAGFNLAGWDAHIQMNGDKPVKVLKLVKHVSTG